MAKPINKLVFVKSVGLIHIRIESKIKIKTFKLHINLITEQLLIYYYK